MNRISVAAGTRLIGLSIPIFLAAGSQAQTFQGLGDLAGGSFLSSATGVSDLGVIVAGFGTDADGVEPFFWSGATQLGLANNDPAAPKASKAFALSADGLISVGQGYDGFSNHTAYRWLSGDTGKNLGDLSLGNLWSAAYAVSADGSVIAGEGSSKNGREAFRYTYRGFKNLGDLPGGDFGSGAMGMDATGSVIAGWSFSANGREAFKWTPNGGMIGLGDLPGGNFDSYATAVSADGSTIVGRGWSDNGREGFIWKSNTGMIALGDLPGGEYYSEALGVSGDGTLVVGWSHTDNGDEAFIWDSTNGMRLLSDVLTNDYGLDLTGWQLLRATAISSDGRAIVGYGLNPLGQVEAWLATIPAANTTQLTFDSMTLQHGTNLGGGLADLDAFDGSLFQVQRSSKSSESGSPVLIQFDATAPWNTASSFEFAIAGHANSTGLTYYVEMWDWTKKKWIAEGSFSGNTADNVHRVIVDNPNRFIDSNTSAVRGRLRVKSTGKTSANPWGISIDLLQWFMKP